MSCPISPKRIPASSIFFNEVSFGTRMRRRARSANTFTEQTSSSAFRFPFPFRLLVFFCFGELVLAYEYILQVQDTVRENDEEISCLRMELDACRGGSSYQRRDRDCAPGPDVEMDQDGTGSVISDVSRDDGSNSAVGHLNSTVTASHSQNGSHQSFEDALDTVGLSGQ
jgi:hypothetical protein